MKNWETVYVAKKDILMISESAKYIAKKLMHTIDFIINRGTFILYISPTKSRSKTSPTVLTKHGILLVYCYYYSPYIILKK